MINELTLVGRLTSDVEIRTTENGTKVANITLAVPRPYKGSSGEYETDFVDITLWKGIAENTANHCRKGNMVGVKGRVETSTRENADGNKEKRTNIIAERVTFLEKKKEKNQDERN